MISYSLSMYDVMISLSMYVLLDKGVHQLSAKGSSYNIWKMGTLDETDVSLSLFGGAHTFLTPELLWVQCSLCSMAMFAWTTGFSMSVAFIGKMLKIGGCSKLWS
jgi:minichromosome maintenance protein 10